MERKGQHGGKKRIEAAEWGMTTLAELIPGVLEKTAQGKLQWEELSSGSYITRVGSLSLELGDVRSVGVRIALLDDRSRVLESATYQTLSNPFDEHLMQLFQLVRRKALGVDQALDSLKSVLDKL
jgi:hypothetical protein